MCLTSLLKSQIHTLLLKLYPSLKIDHPMCSICLADVKEPIVTKCCKNLFCKECIFRYQKFSLDCPLCRISTYKVKEMRKKEINWLGIDQKFLFATCPFGDIQCPNIENTGYFNVLKHASIACVPFQKNYCKCPLCLDTIMKNEDLFSHLMGGECPHFFVRCDFCLENVRPLLSKSHRCPGLTNDCFMRALTSLQDENRKLKS